MEGSCDHLFLVLKHPKAQLFQKSVGLKQIEVGTDALACLQSTMSHLYREAHMTHMPNYVYMCGYIYIHISVSDGWFSTPSLSRF